jgi:hypothetical protein
MTNPATKRIADEHNALREHWSAHFSSNLDLNHAASDHTYKHHIAQLMTIYTDTEQKLVDFSFKTKAVNLPMTTLYGTKGYRSTGPEIQKIYKKRETRWNNRVYLTENLDLLKNPKKKERKTLPHMQGESTVAGTHGDSLDLGQSNSSILLPGNSSVLLPAEPHRPHSQPMGGTGASARGGNSRSRSNSPAQRQGSSPSRANSSEQRQSNRYSGPTREASLSASGDNYGGDFLDSSASYSAGEEPADLSEDLVLRGLYRFDHDVEIDAYNKFVLMLTSFDSHDMLLILQDAFKDAKAATMLDSYGGTGRPFGSEEPGRGRGRSSRGQSQSQSQRRGRSRNAGSGSDGEGGNVDPNSVSINNSEYVFSKAHKPHGGRRV